MNDNKHNIKIKSSIILLSLCLLVFVFVYIAMFNSYGWFSSNKEVKGTGMSVSAKEDDGIWVDRLIVYKYIIDEKRVKVYKNDPLNPEDIIMNAFDTVFTDRQEYAPLLLKISLERTYGNTFTTLIDCDGLLRNTDNLIDNNLSNLISMKCALSYGSGANTLDTLSMNEENDATPENVYNAAKTLFENDSNKVSNSTPITNNKYQEKTFVNYTTNNNQVSISGKNSTISFSFDVHDLVDYEGINQLNLYIYLDYDNTLVNKYLSENMSGAISTSFFEESNIINFKKDIKLIYFER